jgi:hypothetical protein
MTTPAPSTPPSTQASSSLPIQASQPPALPLQAPVPPIQAQVQALPQAQSQVPAQPQVQAIPTHVPIMADYAKGVKKVPFDGTHQNFYLWTTQLLGFVETNNCEQALLGTLTVPTSTDVLDPNDADEKKLLLARSANSTAMCLLRISLTDKISQSELFNSKTKELPLGCAKKAWTNLYTLYYPVNVNKMNELKKDFARSTLYKDDKNTDEWFAELYSIRQRVEDDYKLDKYGDAEMLDQIIYNTKAPAYQMKVTILKDQINTESIRLKADNTYVKEVTLDYVQAKFREIYSTLQLHKGRPSSSTKGPVVLLANGTPPTKKKFTKPFKKDCSLCGEQGHKSVDCYTRPENAHKNPRNKVIQQAFVATSPPRYTISCTYCKKTGHAEKNCFKKRNDQNKSDDHAHVVLFLTEHSLFTKNIPTTLPPTLSLPTQGPPVTSVALLKVYLIYVHILQISWRTTMK